MRIKLRSLNKIKKNLSVKLIFIKKLEFYNLESVKNKIKYRK